MDTKLTPDEACDRISRAHLSVNAFLKRHKLSSTTFWRWQKGHASPHPVTMQKIKDALDKLETAADIGQAA